MNRFRVPLFALLALVVAACQTPAPDATDPEAAPAAAAVDTAAARQAIAQISDAWEAAAATGDHAGITALYADDAIIHPANQPPASGREALAAYFAESFGQPATDFVLTTNDIEFSDAGDMAYEVGTSSAPTGPGKYLTVYRMDGDRWLIVADTWSDDAPPAASAN
jgi:uncharacterized protein (TIGR02246 family)